MNLWNDNLVYIGLFPSQRRLEPGWRPGAPDKERRPLNWINHFFKSRRLPGDTDKRSTVETRTLQSGENTKHHWLQPFRSKEKEAEFQEIQPLAPSPVLVSCRIRTRTRMWGLFIFRSYQYSVQNFSSLHTLPDISHSPKQQEAGESTLHTRWLAGGQWQEAGSRDAEPRGDKMMWGMLRHL